MAPKLSLRKGTLVIPLIEALAVYLLAPVVVVFLIACVLSLFFDPPKESDPSWFKRRDW